MAISFPNFLAAALNHPDYGIGDIVSNYYAGKSMPKDDLIKQVQAQFARPNAEQALLSSRLGNEKSQLEIAKFKREQAQQAQFEAALNAALTQGAETNGNPSPAPRGGMPAQGMPSFQPPQQPMSLSQAPRQMTMQNDPMEAISRINPALAQALQQGGTGMGGGGGGMDAPNAPAFTPIASMGQSDQQMPAETAAQQQQPQEQVLEQGSPHLAGVDALYDKEPRSRPYLESKGYKKEVKRERDKKSGAEMIYTKYPSGKITVKKIMPDQAGGDAAIPLTNKMVSTHQRVISSVDNALPLLERLKNMPNHSNIYTGNAFATHDQKKYQRLVNAVKENLIGAFALNPTEAGLQTAVDQLTIGGWESDKDYKEALQDLIDDLKGKKSYSATEVRRSNKISPIDTSVGGGSSDYSDLGQYDTGGE